MICPQCQHDNPEGNRFCGTCGAALIAEPAVATTEAISAEANDKPQASTASEPTASHYDPEGYDEEDAPKLSPEVIDYDRQIPLIAEPGSDRRRSVPKHILDEVHDFLDEIQEPVTTPSRNDTRADSRELREAESARAHARADAALNDRQPQTRRNYIDLDDARESRQESDRVSGPSFLGLGNTDYEYVYDDQRPSHWRRNFSLLVLVVLAVLAAVQWRSIRDMGLEYAKSGTVKVHVPKRGEPAQSDASSNPNTPSSSASGTPNISVDPTRNADAENAKLRAEEEAAKGQQSPQPQNNSAVAGNNSQPNAAAASTPPAVPPADTATTDDLSNPRTANSNSTDKNSPSNTRTSARTGNNNNAPSAMGAPAASSSNASPSVEEATPPPTRASAAPSPRTRGTRMPAPTSSRSVPGSFEMQQASALGQTASAVPWLWTALGKGNPDAPVKLADMYLTGHGVEKSCDQGLVILRSAAARGNARASARLGTLYATGICVQLNRVQAYEWMGTAAGRSQSLSSWADAYRQNLLQQMTPEERARVR